MENHKLDPSEDSGRFILDSDVVAYGHMAAIFLSRLRGWLKCNAKNPKAHRQGRVWSYSTLDEIAIDLKMSKDQVRGIVKKLSKAGVLLTGCFNDHRSNRTAWYAIDDGFNPTPCGEIPTPCGDDPTSSIKYIKQNKLEEVPPHSDFSTAFQANEGAAVIPFPMKFNKEPGEMSEATNNRLKAFQAVRNEKQKTENIGPYPEADEGRGSLARRQERDNRAGRPRKSKARGEAKRTREPLRCAPFEAWSAAMSKIGIWSPGIVDKRDIEDAARLVTKLGEGMTEADATAYAVWTVENWPTLLKRWPKLEEYQRSFGMISSRWMESFVPLWLSNSSSGGEAKVQGSDAFREYMALTQEQQSTRDPQKEALIRNVSELMKAYDAYEAAKREMRRKAQ